MVTYFSFFSCLRLSTAALLLGPNKGRAPPSKLSSSSVASKPPSFKDFIANFFLTYLPTKEFSFFAQ